jgi:hypothetical protein
LNATVTAVDAGVLTANQTLPVGANGTVTMTMTVIPSDVACHCECDCRNAGPQASLLNKPLVVKNNVGPMTVPLVLMGGMLAFAVLMD